TTSGRGRHPAVDDIRPWTTSGRGRHPPWMTPAMHDTGGGRHPPCTTPAADAATRLVADAVGSGSGVQAGRVMVELSRLSGASGLRPPSEMAMVGKALLNLDQVTSHLGPGFDPSEVVKANDADITRSRMHTSPGSLLAAAMEAKDFTARLPGRVNEVLDSLSEGSFSAAPRSSAPS
ncbi:MAG: ubiquinone biosynthesis protein, partial [Actinoplanes sp.]|nr:ubiquinone biosynthesis protein [Actinoplanes sp.]